MELKNFFNLVKYRLGTIGVLVAVFFVLGVGVTLIQPLKYSSHLSLLVVEDAGSATDPYTAARASEYLSDILSKVSYSTTFYNQVLNAGLNVDSSYFGTTNKQISKNWGKTIDVKAVANTGIIDVTAYHPNRDQAERIARAVGSVLITQNGNYHGLGDRVSLKLLDDPITSTYPVSPNLLINAALAIVLGLIFSLSFVYLWPEIDLLRRSTKPEWQATTEADSQLNLYQTPEVAEVAPALLPNYNLAKETLPINQEVATPKELKTDTTDSSRFQQDFGEPKVNYDLTEDTLPMTEEVADPDDASIDSYSKPKVDWRHDF